MKKSILLSLLLFYFSAKSQDGLTRQYQFNPLAINPAFAGENGVFSVKTLLGQQFNGTLRFNQVNQILAIDGQLFNQGGLAFQAFRSNIGNLISRGLSSSFSKGFELGDVNLKVGINSGLMINNQLTTSVNTQIAPFAGLGILASYKGIFVGVSKPMLIYSKKIYDYKPLYFQLGYLYFPQNSNLSFNLNTLIYATAENKNFDVNAKAWYNQRVGFGVSFRKNNIYPFIQNPLSIVPYLDYKMYKSVHIGISYDKNAINNALDNNSSGTSFENDLKLRGIFQIFFRYTSNPEQGDSKFYNKF